LKILEHKLGDLYLENSRNGIYKSPEFQGRGVKLIKMNQQFGHRFIHDQLSDIELLELTDDELSRFELAENDLLFSRTSVVPEGVGMCSIVRAVSEPLAFESNIIRVRLDPNKSNPEFVFRYFQSHLGRGKILAIAGGTNIKTIKGSSLKEVSLPLPSRAIQDSTVGSLRAYDDLIGNNHRRIQLLEESARLIYREWFTYLGFPGHEHAIKTDGIPEGWKSVPLAAICSDIRDSVKPSQLKHDTPYIGLEHIPRRSITLNEWGFAEEVESNKLRYVEGDILFGKIRPYFHKVGFTLTDGVCSSDAVVIRAHDQDIAPYVLALVSSDQFVAIASKTAKEGSKMPRADWKFMQQHPVLLPSRQVLLSFRDTMLPIMQQLKVLALQNQKLAQARDLLLPRLMNGEITV
jgi:type I restriction enzyme S subunit